MKLRRLIIDPRSKIFFLLCLIWLAGIEQQKNFQAVLFPLYSILLFAGFDLILTYGKTKKLYLPLSSLISGLLIGFLIHPSSGIFAYFLAVFLGFASKHFLKLQGRHIFNPAALGVVISSLILNFPISWWAVAGNLFGVIIPILSVFMLYKLRRLQLPFIFLTGYFLLLYFSIGLKEAFSLIFEGTVFLFSFIMLPEPMTSNISGWWRYGFGLTAVGVFIFISLGSISLPDPLLMALLITNLLGKSYSLIIAKSAASKQL